MQVEELKSFLKKFSIDDVVIEDFLKDKKLIEVNGNIFLTQSEFKKNEIYKDELIFIKLINLLPSKFLLEFIKKTSQNKIEVLVEKQALIFTYGKGLKKDMVKGKNLEKGKYYLTQFNRKILGYAEITNDSEYPIQPIMNIGEYLKENNNKKVRRR